MTQQNPVKFLMILNELSWFWTHRLPLAEGILRKGWTLSVATNGADKEKDFKNLNITGIDMPRLGRSLNPWPQIKLMLAIYKIIKKQRPDIIHVITIRYAFYVGLVTRIIGYNPVVFTVAGLGSLYTAPGLKMKLMRLVVLPLIRFAFGGQSKSVIFQNPDDQKAMVDTNIVKLENTNLIRGSGVDLNKFQFHEYNDNDELPIILFSSRLLREKGITDFIEAARILKSECFKARFIVAGSIYEDNARSLTRAEIMAPHEQGIIEWVGQEKDMPTLLKKSMMMVLPSYYGEGVPKALLEAAATGRPIVTCDVPGCREVVSHEENGLLVLPQFPTELAAAIRKLAEDPQKRHAFGLANRKKMEEDFHVEHVVSQTLSVYEDLLKKP